MDSSKRRAVISSLGRMDLGEARKQPVLTVEDESFDGMNFESGNFEQDDMEQEIRQSKEIRKKAPQNAINRFEILTGIGRLVKDVEIGDCVFSIRSLKNRESREVYEKALEAKSNIIEALIIRNATLARAIYKIDGIAFEKYVGDNEAEDLIDEMDGLTISKLWAAYTNMLSEHQDSLADDLGKTPKEVVENIKKS